MKKNSKGPKYWIVAITKQQDLIKWGKDGDVKLPLTDPKVVAVELAYLKTSPEHMGDVFYVLKVFPTGEMVTMEDLDGEPVNPVDFEHWLELIHGGYFLSDGQFINTAVIHWGKKNRSAIERIVSSHSDMKRLKARYEECIGEIVKVVK